MSAKSATILFIGALGLDGGGASSDLMEALKQVLEQVATADGNLSAVLLAGPLTQNGTAEEFDALEQLVKDVLGAASRLGIVEKGPCPVLAVPGATDLAPIRPERAVVRSLQGSWADAGPALFACDAPEELDAIQQAFDYFDVWSSDHHSGLPGWYDGMIPGDASCTFEAAGLRVGVIAVNSALRRIAPSAGPDLETVEPAQLIDATGDEDLGAWADDRDLVVLLAASPGQSRDVGLPREDFVGLFGDARSVGDDPRVRLYRAGESVIGTLDVAVAVEVGRLERWGAAGLTPVVEGSEENTSTPRPDVPDTASAPSSDDAIRQFAADMATGRTVLVMFDHLQPASHEGAEANESSGRAALRRLLMDLLSATTDDRGVGMGELLRYARDRNPHAAHVAIQSVATVTDAASVELVRRTLRAPWERVYDAFGSNGCDLALQGDETLGKSCLLTNAIEDTTRAPLGVRQVIALNGWGHSSPDTTQFDVPAAEGKGSRDTWYRRLAADFVKKPVVIMAETSDDPDLWAYLRYRAATDEEQNDSLSRTYLVCPRVTSETRWRLAAAGISLIEKSIAWFVRERLSPNRQEIADGLVALARAGGRGRRAKGLRLVSSLLGEVDTRGEHELSGSDFLRGHDPSWSDIANERPPRLSRLEHLAERVSLVPEQRNVVLLLGRSGSGKTTTLMQFAADLVRSGLVVGWVDRSFGETRDALVNDAIEMEVDAVLLDNVDMFGNDTNDTMRLLNRRGKVLVVASLRRTNIYVLGGSRAYAEANQDEPLTDGDIEKVIGALRKHSLLNILRKVRPESSRVETFRQLSSRDLMAGLIQVVEGEPFDVRIASEYRQLGDLERLAYGIVSFVSHLNETPSIPWEHILQILSPAPPYREAERAVEALIGQRLVIDVGVGAVKCRHRAIADRVVDAIRTDNGLVPVVQSLLEFYAEQAHNIEDSSDPDRRQMIALLNHNLMKRLQLPVMAVRSLYQSVREWLEEDLHYWLQRGSYEVELGELDQAKGYIVQAQGCVGGSEDHKVLTEWSLLMLKRANGDPHDSRLHDGALLAIATLEQVAKRHRGSSPHTFAVAVGEGTRWLTSSRVMDDRERRDMARRISEIMELGLQVTQNGVFLDAVGVARPTLQKLLENSDEGVRLV